MSVHTQNRSTTPPDKTQHLQRKLYLAAKGSRNRSFHAFSDRIFRPDRWAAAINVRIYDMHSQGLSRRPAIYHAWLAIGRQQNSWRLIYAIMETRERSASTGMGAKANKGATVMQRITEWTLVVLGALLCISGATSVWQAQISSPNASLWPLPALVLIEWMLLGVVGMIAAFGDRRAQRSLWTTIRWTVCGALFGLLILGLFSIGPLVLLAALSFLGAAMLADHRYQRIVNAQVGVLTAGTVGKVGLLLMLISLARV